MGGDDDKPKGVDPQEGEAPQTEETSDSKVFSDLQRRRVQHARRLPRVRGGRAAGSEGYLPVSDGCGYSGRPALALQQRGF